MNHKPIIETIRRISTTLIRDEEGVGFMESLVAIIIGGIACTALLSVAVGVVREANNNQIRDGMNLYAMPCCFRYSMPRLQKAQVESEWTVTCRCCFSPLTNV